MMTILASLLAAAQLCAAVPLESTLPQQLRSGECLRLHVIAQDDSDEMQRLKLCVRDAVQACYVCNRSSGTMLEQAERLLPQLTEAACTAAAAEGFDMPVAVSLETCVFDERELAGVTVPAGEYPALMIRLGDARGRNWWGLLDPELALAWARVPQEEQAEEPIIWDWSWEALLAALLGRPLAYEGV